MDWAIFPEGRKTFDPRLQDVSQAEWDKILDALVPRVVTACRAVLREGQALRESEMQIKRQAQNIVELSARASECRKVLDLRASGSLTEEEMVYNLRLLLAPAGADKPAIGKGQ